MNEFKIDNSNNIDIDLRQNTLLEASAGTGKTYSLERVILNLIKDSRYNLSIQDILVVTFTKKATREMKERIRVILIEEFRKESDLRVKHRLEQAISNFDEAAIFTIHGFCQNTLQAYPFESMSLFNQEISQDDSYITEAIWDYLRELELTGSNDIFDEYRSFRGGLSFSDVVNELIDLYKRDEFRGSCNFLPDDLDRNEFLKLKKEFDSGDGSLFHTIEGFKILGAEAFLAASKAMGVGTRISSFEKLALGFQGVDISLGLIEFLRSFKESGFEENANKLTTTFLESKSKKGTLVSELDVEHSEIILEIDNIFAHIEDFTPIDRFLSGEFIKSALKGIDLKVKKVQEGAGILSFNDLIENLHNRVMDNKDDSLLKILRDKYKIALIDEFQDTDKKQWDIFSKIFGEDREHNFFLIGDPKQSIYGFRGADLEIYYRARNSVKPENRYFLGKNFRSEPGIVNGVNSIFSSVFGVKGMGHSVPVSFSKVDHANKSPRYIDNVTQNIEFIIYDEDVKEGKAVGIKSCKKGYFKSIITKIVNILNNKESNLLPGDIAILVENHKDSIFLRDLLLNKGVPVVISKQKNVYFSDESNHLLSLLKALNRPGGASEIKELLLTPIFNYSLKEINDMEDSGEIEVISTQLLMWNQTLIKSGLISLWEEIEGFSNKGHLQTRLLTTVDGERAYTNYKHLIENLNSLQKSERLNSLSLYQKLQHLMESSTEDEENSVRLDRESEAVQIMTIHASKGLEFPVVFFAGALGKGGDNPKNKGVKFAEKGGIWTLDFLKRDRSKLYSERDEWEEKKRLYYVAFTRAVSKLYLPLFPNGELTFLSSLYGSINWDQNKIMIEDRLGDSFSMCEQPGHKQIVFPKNKAGKELKNEYINLLYEDVIGLVEEDGNSFAIDDTTYLSPNSNRYELPQNLDILNFLPLKNPRSFRNRVTWVSSYSGLTKNSHGSISKEDADRDDDGEIVTPIYKKSDKINTFNIPGGATFGDLVHEFFEEVEFSKYKLSLDEYLVDEDVDQLLLKGIKKHFGLEWGRKYGQITKEITWNTLNSKLNLDGDIVPVGAFGLESRIHEKEFYFRVDVKNSFISHNLELTVEEGYLKGFIDLIVKHNGKLYIGDWKSTTIRGDESFENYSNNRVEDSMNEHNYHLQGLIYTVALYLHLKATKPDFNYSKDIGGYFYLYVRGMHPGSSTGISYNSPTEDEVLNFISELRG